MSEHQDPAPAGDPNPAPAGETGSQSRESGNDGLAAELRIARKQLKEAQAKITSFESAASESERAKLGEVDRYKAEAADWKAKFESATTRSESLLKSSAFRFAAHQAGVVNVEDALKLADLSEVVVDGDQVHGVDAALKSLLKGRQYLLGRTAPATSNGGGNPGTGAPELTKEQLRKMSPAERRELQKKALSGEWKP